MLKGILYAKDVLPYTGNPDSFKWQALMRPPYFVPETKKINESAEGIPDKEDAYGSCD